MEQHPEHRDDDPHALMIARLHNEKEMREALEAQRKELLAQKQELIAENKKRKEDLASLDEQLKKFIEVCVIEILGIGILANANDSPRSLSKQRFRSSTKWPDCLRLGTWRNCSLALCRIDTTYKDYCCFLACPQIWSG